MATEWTDILEEQPRQGQRVLVELLSSQVRITTYDRFDYAHWAIAAWKPIPDEQRGKSL